MLSDLVYRCSDHLRHALPTLLHLLLVLHASPGDRALDLLFVTWQLLRDTAPEVFANRGGR